MIRMYTLIYIRFFSGQRRSVKYKLKTFVFVRFLISHCVYLLCDLEYVFYNVYYIIYL